MSIRVLASVLLGILCSLSFAQDLQDVAKKFSDTQDSEILGLVAKIESQDKVDNELAETYYDLASLFWIKGDYKSTEWIANEIDIIGKSVGSEHWQAVHHTIKGNIFNRKSLLNEALFHYNEALLKYFKTENTEKVAIIRNNLSVLYLKMKNLPLALEQSNEALKTFLELGDDRHLSQTYTNLGNVYSGLGDSTKALESYMRCLEIDTKLKDTIGLSIDYTNIGTIYADMGNYSLARIFFENALSLDSAAKDENSIMISLHNLGYNYLNQGEYNKALPYLQMSLLKAQKLSSFDYMLENMRAISKIHANSENPALAYAALDESLNIYDSLFNAKRISELKKIQDSYELQQRSIENQLLKAEQARNEAKIERQTISTYIFISGILIGLIAFILLLTNRNRIKKLNQELRLVNRNQKRDAEKITKQKEKLQQVIRENKELTSILIHDLKNPLSQIKILNDMNLESVSNSASEHLVENFEMVSRAAKNALDLIERLNTAQALEEGKLNPVFRKLDIQQLLSEILEYFESQAKRKGIQLEFHCDQKIMWASDARFLQNIIQNLIENAIKFSPRNSAIELKALLEDNKLVIAVKDQGPGFNEQDKNKLFERYAKLSARPTSGETSSGLGLSISYSLANRLGGELALNPEFEKGAEFVLKLPKISGF